MKKIHKLFNIDIKSVNEADRQITFCFSDNQEDRMGEIVDQSTWDVKNYLLNPIILFGHDSSQPENVLGQGVALNLDQGGKSYITAQFDEAEINPTADMVFRQLIKRTLRCVSAGFVNHSSETVNDIPVLKDNELLEVSIVPIPANPRALALQMREGSISHKDGQWLLDNMRKEADWVEKQLSVDDAKGSIKEKAMEEKIDQLTGLIAKLAESQTALTDAVAALTPAAETAEAKTAREAQETADKAAADQKVIDDAAEEARVAAEEAAKGGGNDQSGAGADAEIDPEAQLTPELQATIDAQLAELQAA